jgi:endonuclease YncB( thermonuclease family)
MLIKALVTNLKKVSTSFLLLLLLPSFCNADVLIGKVIAIADGDTITILADNTPYKIRLSGIDAPEKRQAFGNQSKQSLADIVFQKTVIVNFNKLDKYNRIVGKVTFDDTDINLEQIKRGLAWHYEKYASEQDVEDQSIYADEEYLAQVDKKGLWTELNPIPPWKFRKINKNL